MNADNVPALKLYLCRVKAALSKDNFGDKAMFADIIKDLTRLMGLSITDIQHKYGVSKPTVEMWLSQERSPHPLMCEAVYYDLEMLVRAEIARLES
jgi:hypothetical protein